MKPKRSERSLLPVPPTDPPRQTISALLHLFLREVRAEPGFEKVLLTSPSLRSFLLQISSVMELGSQAEVLKVILFGNDEAHALQAARTLARTREKWSFELLDAALRSPCAQTRLTALRGSAASNTSFLIPRLREAVCDPDERIRVLALKLLHSHPGTAVSDRDTKLKTQLCRDRPQEEPRIGACPYQSEKPEYWEWEMTTFNTPRYRRR